LYNLPNQPDPERALNELMRVLLLQFEKCLPASSTVHVNASLANDKTYVVGSLQSEHILPSANTVKRPLDPCPEFIHLLRNIRAEYTCFSNPHDGTYLEFKVPCENLVLDFD
jgi:hypothetical protein